MTEAEWLASSEPAWMLDRLQVQSLPNYIGPDSYMKPPSDRKLRLFTEACGALGFCYAYTYGLRDVDAQHMVACVADEPHSHFKPAVAAILRHLVGNPFRPVSLRPTFSAALQSMAKSLQDGLDCDFALHDALVDAGHAELAKHFGQLVTCAAGMSSAALESGACSEWLSAGRHPEGCWVLDLILGEA